MNPNNNIDNNLFDLNNEAHQPKDQFVNNADDAKEIIDNSRFDLKSEDRRPKSKFINNADDEKKIEQKRESDMHKIGVDKAYQLHEHKDRMFNWIINMSSYYLIIVLIIFSLSMFEVRKDLDEYWFYAILAFLFLAPFILTFSIPLIKKIDDAVSNFDNIKKKSNFELQRGNIKNEEKVKEAFGRKTFKRFFITFSGGCFVFLAYLILSKIINIRDSSTAPDSAIIIALITSTTGTIIALPALVAKIIFDEKK